MATTVSAIYEIKDVFDQDDWDSIEQNYSCTICTELIYKQEWYQCSDGHTGCANCWNKIIDKAKELKIIPLCPICKKELKDYKESLSRCRFIEQNFNNLKISCPYSFNQSIINSREDGSTLEPDIENGCKEIIKIEQLDNHQTNCNSRFVKCNNDGCDNISRYNQHQQQHQNQCAHAIIQCELCEASIKRSSLSNHQNECPSAIIVCNQCPFELKSSELQYHITNQCPNSIIECRFQAYGCNTRFKRSETSNHLQQVNHTEFMMKQIDQQSDKLNQQKQQLTQQTDKLNQQSQQLNQQSDILNQQSHKLNQQSDKLNQQTQQLNQQSKQLNQQSQQLNQQIDKQTQQLKQQSDKLNQQTQQLNQQSQELESCKKDLESSKDTLNTLLDQFNILNFKLKNIVSYSNTWIISDFINKTRVGKPQLYSPFMKVSPYKFLLETRFKDGYQQYYLYVMESENGNGKAKVKFSFKLLNCKDTSKSVTKNYEEDININSYAPYCVACFIVEYSKESGYIFPDDSVHIEFTIDIARTALQS